jgi:5S rRNA maturation endonuclease (ribonuclease M5)
MARDTIALLDVDSKIPNLALMKLSAWHKAQGDEVVWYDDLWRDTYDKIYASTVFKFSDKSILDQNRMEIGGTGWDYEISLPPEVDICQPDYSLYGYPHNIGFTMRGCRFRCKFCVVPQKEGKPYEENTIDEIWQQRGSNFIVLLDNDFFGNPAWQKRIDEIKQCQLTVNFSQGLNIRIITEEQTVALASVKFSNINKTAKQVHFAWDQFGKGTERLIDQGIKRVTDAGIKPSQMAFYVLIGFNTTPEQDLYRVEKLRDYGCDPYVMPFDKSDPYQQKFARWVNHKAIFKSVRWEEYRRSRKDFSRDADTQEMFADAAATT